MNVETCRTEVTLPGAHVDERHRRDWIIHWAGLYDLTTGLLGRRGHQLRASIADRLKLHPGDRVLDVGSGTGRLAVVLAQRVGPTGSVTGIDPSKEMVARATAKARSAEVPVTFQEAFAQQLPFAGASFDAVTCTLALHHVADPDRPTAVAEMYRVLRPGRHSRHRRIPGAQPWSTVAQASSLQGREHHRASSRAHSQCRFH